MIFKLIKASVAALALLTVPFAAQAADVPIKPPYYKGPPRSVVSYYNWTGFYAGINAGYGWGSSDWSAVPASIKPKGALVGGTLGYNWQSGAIVYGIEGDFDWSDVSGSVACGGASVVGARGGSWAQASRLRTPSHTMLSMTLMRCIESLLTRDIIEYAERRKLEDARDVKSDHTRWNVSPRTAV